LLRLREPHESAAPEDPDVIVPLAIFAVFVAGGVTILLRRALAAHRSAEGSRGGPSWLQLSLLPYLVGLTLPFVTVPLTIFWVDQVTGTSVCVTVPSLAIDKVWHCERNSVLLTLLPGVLNLLPFAWLASRLAEVRRAAVVAGSLGAARLTIPVVLLFAEGPTVRLFGSYQFPPAQAGNWSLVASPVLWLLTLVATVSVARSTSGRLLWAVVTVLASFILMLHISESVDLLHDAP